MHTVGLPRTCLGFTNILFFLAGFLGAVICVWCVINTQFFQDVNYTITNSAMVGTIADFVNLKLWVTPMTTILIAIAFLTMITSCCGILGAGCKVKCAVKSYILLVTVISFIAFWIVFITCFYNIYTQNAKTRQHMERSLQSNYGKENDMITFVWNYVMMNYECCGVNNYKDFANTNWQKKSKILHPVQCCKLANKTSLIPVSKDCTQTIGPDIESFVDKGCFEVLGKSFAENKGKMIFYMVLIAIAYSLLTLFAYCIIRGEPLLGTMAGQFSFLPSKVHQNPIQTVPVSLPPPRPSYVEPRYVEEPPQKVVRVVSAVNPFQTYKYAPDAYSGEMCPHTIR